MKHLLVFVGVGFALYLGMTFAETDPPTQATPPVSTFDCAQKTCKEMSSCEEACYKLKECGYTQLDRDKDGIPCENVCSAPCP